MYVEDDPEPILKFEVPWWIQMPVSAGIGALGAGIIVQWSNCLFAETGLYLNSVAAMNIIDAADALVTLERTVAAVKGHEMQGSKFARLWQRQGSLAQRRHSLGNCGRFGGDHHGYERFTKEIDIVVRSGNLDILTRVAPHYGIKVIRNDPDGWHKLQCEGVPIDVVPEGRKPRKDAPAAIPGPEQLGVREGAGYAGIAGWMETKLGSYRVQDRAESFK